MKTVISTEKAPAAIGPYSQGIQAGSLIITSGQLPIDPATGAMPEDVSAQTKQSLTNGKAIVEASGNMSMERVPAVAATGVDVISVGALTHSVRSIDLGLDWN